MTPRLPLCHTWGAMAQDAAPADRVPRSLLSGLILLRRSIRRRLSDWRGRTHRTRLRWNPSQFTDAFPDLFWTRARVVREYLHEMASGNPRCDWVTWMLHRYAVGHGLRVLVLGSGDGWLDRVLAKDPRIAHVTGVDLAEATLARAAGLAASEGLAEKIRHAVVDLDDEPPPPGPYDFVFAHDVIHHIRDLEGFFDRISRCLAPAGMLLFCEYVGPRRFEYDEKRRSILNEFLRALPEKYRRLPYTGGVAMEGHRTDSKILARQDPSEAVRSDEIMPIVRQRMRVVEEIPYGGSLLNPLLWEVITNFEDDNEADEAILKQLCAAERVLIQTGTIPSDYMIVAARARDGV